MEAIRGGCDHRSLELPTNSTKAQTQICAILKGELSPARGFSGRVVPNRRRNLGLGFYSLSALAMIRCSLASLESARSWMVGATPSFSRRIFDWRGANLGCVCDRDRLIAYWNSLGTSSVAKRISSTRSLIGEPLFGRLNLKATR